MATTTAAAIRSRLAELVVAASRPDVPFREHRYDQDGDFIAWAESHPDAALRRFSLRLEVKDADPFVMSVTEEWREAWMTLLIAYPRTNRFGALNALGLDDAIRADQRLLEATVGVRGNHNLAGLATVMPQPTEAISWAAGESCDFLLVSQRLGYWADATAY